MTDEQEPNRHPTIHELVDALLLFDEPILNRRFHEVLARLSTKAERESMAALPGEVLRAERSAREGAEEWERHGGIRIGAAFPARAERMLIEAFLSLAESEIRLCTFLARSAPHRDARIPFDAAATRLRNVAVTLRQVAGSASEPAGGAEAEAIVRGRIPPIQVLATSDGLRERVEGAIRQLRQAGKEPRILILTHIAYRRLRDDGCFHDGIGKLAEVPVSIDLGWDGVAFAVLTYDAATLEELAREV